MQTNPAVFHLRPRLLRRRRSPSFTPPPPHSLPQVRAGSPTGDRSAAPAAARLHRAAGRVLPLAPSNIGASAETKFRSNQSSNSNQAAAINETETKTGASALNETDTRTNIDSNYNQPSTTPRSFAVFSLLSHPRTIKSIPKTALPKTLLRR